MAGSNAPDAIHRITDVDHSFPPAYAKNSFALKLPRNQGQNPGQSLDLKKSHAGDAVRAHHQVEAERIVSILARDLGLPEPREELEQLKKSDAREILCAALVKRRASVSKQWIAERLAMGHPASMSQHLNRMRKEPTAAKRIIKHEKSLQSNE